MLPAKTRGRTPGFRMSNEHRLKIQRSLVLTRLIQHVEGHCEMSATQVTAGLGLLRKCLPDLTSVSLSGDGEGGAITVEIRRFSDPAGLISAGPSGGKLIEHLP
jgi:hypothetical protein